MGSLLFVNFLSLYVPALYMLVWRVFSSRASSSISPRINAERKSYTVSDYRTVGTRRDIEDLEFKIFDKARYISDEFISEFNLKKLFEADNPDRQTKRLFKTDSGATKRDHPLRTNFRVSRKSSLPEGGRIPMYSKKTNNDYKRKQI